MSKTLPKDLTSYDLLKTLAILLMVADHIGYYLYPEQAWWRIAGRLSVPIWFFLIGYARSRDVPNTLWLGGLALLLSSMIAGEFFFPLSILFTLAIGRLCVDGIMARALRGYRALFGVSMLMFLMAFPSMVVTEYGSLGLLFVMFGFMRRRKDDLLIKPLGMFTFIVGINLAYLFIEMILLPPISMLQFSALCGGLFALSVALFYFTPQIYPRLSRLIGPFKYILQFTGRRTLAIYVIHLLFFRGLAMWLDPERFGFLDFQFAPSGMLALFIAH